jgi:hypothetical protein
MASPKTCAHPPCECLVDERSEFGKYCSSWCQTAKDTPELKCDCGHPGCAEDPAVGWPPAARTP